MKKLRWQLLIIFFTGLVVGILLLGEQPKPVSTVASPEPVKGGVYTEALVGSLLRLNPLLSIYNPADQDVSRLIFNGLVRFDSNGGPQPDLAESYGFSQDGTLYNVTLRKDAKWHDGEPVVADDVIYTVELLRQGAGIIPQDVQDFWKEVEVVKLGDDMLQFRLPGAFAPFLDYLSFGVLPSHLLAGQTLEQLIDSPFNLQPVGTGPYRFNQLIVEDGQIKGVSLRANDDYYQTRPYIDEIVFRYYPDAAGALQAYRDGFVQGLGMVTEDILPQVLSEPGLAVYTARRPELGMVLFNLNTPEAEFFKDVKVRKALLLGLNRQWIVDHILQGQASIADGPILPGTWAYYDGLKREAYDPEAAVALLKEAGYGLAEEGDVVRKKGEVALRFTLSYPDSELNRQVAEYLRDQWNALGAQVELEGLTYDQLISERLDPRSYQVALVDMNLTQSPDPDPYPFWDQAQVVVGQNYTQWDHRVASEYLEQARITVNMTERARLYRNFQIIFAQELPALPLYNPMYTYAVSRDVQGVRVGPLFDEADRFDGITAWFLTSQQCANDTRSIKQFLAGF
jgi:peptide/nickel transport system substrate-binding protein